MIKYLLLTYLIVIGLSNSIYAQKTTTITYINTFDGDELPILTDLSDYKNQIKYSRINEKLIVKTEFQKRDTEIWYYLLDSEYLDYYKIILDPRNKEHFLRKYGVVYKRKRNTPITK